jgi:hypothetical protein
MKIGNLCLDVNNGDDIMCETGWSMENGKWLLVRLILSLKLYQCLRYVVIIPSRLLEHWFGLWNKIWIMWIGNLCLDVQNGDDITCEAVWSMENCLLLCLSPLVPNISDWTCRTGNLECELECVIIKMNINGNERNIGI